MPTLSPPTTMASSTLLTTSLLGAPLPNHLFLATASFLSAPLTLPCRSNPISALFGGNSGDGKEKKKFITRREEPEQYWQTGAEKEGKGPMSTPLPYIVIFGFLTPFVILGIAFANGWIKVPIR